MGVFANLYHRFEMSSTSLSVFKFSVNENEPFFKGSDDDSLKTQEDFHRLSRIMKPHGNLLVIFPLWLDRQIEFVEKVGYT